ncbi:MULTISPECIES: hypothetical protein [Bacillus subtilis group]|uniref:hypothetical protein n=1 Tax=Bacillus subtilis group TaxID=653685 RepID=UPI000FF8FB07|nr:MULTISPECIES: hypothetical protein [Bacillus subtilis group]QAS18826.1 hypothetical protein EQJ69_23145 [Bacillus licheniformis]
MESHLKTLLSERKELNAYLLLQATKIHEVIIIVEPCLDKRRHNEILEDCAKKPHEEEAQQFLKHSLLKQRKNGLKPVGCSLEKNGTIPH